MDEFWDIIENSNYNYKTLLDLLYENVDHIDFILLFKYNFDNIMRELREYIGRMPEYMIEEIGGRENITDLFLIQIIMSGRNIYERFMESPINEYNENSDLHFYTEDEGGELIMKPTEYDRDILPSLDLKASPQNLLNNIEDIFSGYDKSTIHSNYNNDFIGAKYREYYESLQNTPWYLHNNIIDNFYSEL